ncbi:MAG: TIR domain-containing protein [Hyphomicrobiales bacterium]|nr:TIR domain-containing protein [Hyphomicrobiales bacterium]
MLQYRISVFISHSWGYEGHYNTLRSWLFDKPGVVQSRRPIIGRTLLYFRDNSVPKDDPIHTGGSDYELENAIFTKILHSDVIVIPTGMYAEHSEWIKREINLAIRCRRPKLAVDLWGQKRSASVVRNNADEEAGWNRKSVIDKIWQLYNRPAQQLKNSPLS